MLKKMVSVVAISCFSVAMSCCGMNELPSSDIQERLGVTRVPSNLKNFVKKGDSIQLIFNIDDCNVRIGVYKRDFNKTIVEEKKVAVLKQAEHVASFLKDKEIPSSLKDIRVGTLDKELSLDLIFSPDAVLQIRFDDIKKLSTVKANEYLEHCASEAAHYMSKMQKNKSSTKPGSKSKKSRSCSKHDYRSRAGL